MTSGEARGFASVVKGLELYFVESPGQSQGTASRLLLLALLSRQSNILLPLYNSSTPYPALLLVRATLVPAQQAINDDDVCTVLTVAVVERYADLLRVAQELKRSERSLYQEGEAFREAAEMYRYVSGR